MLLLKLAKELVWGSFERKNRRLEVFLKEIEGLEGSWKENREAWVFEMLKKKSTRGSRFELLDRARFNSSHVTIFSH